jgi:cytochrome b561
MVKGFSRVQIALHWVVAALIFFNLLMDNDLGRLMEQASQGGVAATTTVAWAHIIAGSAILVLAAWRLVLRFTRGVPEAPAGEGRMLKMAGDAGHVLLYVLMFAMPVTGLLAWFGGVTSLADIHGEALKIALWLLIIGHVVAAFYHHFYLKDGLLNRMRKAQD